MALYHHIDANIIKLYIQSYPSYLQNLNPNLKKKMLLWAMNFATKIKRFKHHVSYKSSYFSQ